LSSLAWAQTKWDLATGYPDTSFHVKNLREFAQDVSARTNSEVAITVHATGSLVKAPDVKQAAIDGKLAAGEVLGPSLGAVHPVFALDTIPFLATSYPTARRLWNLSRPLTEKKWAAQGFAVLYSVPWPPQGMFSAKAIRSILDSHGLNMRKNSPSVKKLAETLGTKPVLVETPGFGQGHSVRPSQPGVHLSRTRCGHQDVGKTALVVPSQCLASAQRGDGEQASTRRADARAARSAGAR